ncbi:hypothetical protein TCON_1963 [Astathelohania contejeani]|uniref:Uncharacterized protein n=1 Tax=Astathelohania contejeani TaxID=164912 RepID=A0ABQ7HXD2_9MICR|nr:hypothetical protein TCON_1963 [Thelohania contejeani]
MNEEMLYPRIMNRIAFYLVSACVLSLWFYCFAFKILCVLSKIFTICNNLNFFVSYDPKNSEMAVIDVLGGNVKFPINLVLSDVNIEFYLDDKEKIPFASIHSNEDIIIRKKSPLNIKHKFVVNTLLESLNNNAITGIKADLSVICVKIDATIKSKIVNIKLNNYLYKKKFEGNKISEPIVTFFDARNDKKRAEILFSVSFPIMVYLNLAPFKCSLYYGKNALCILVFNFICSNKITKNGNNNNNKKKEFFFIIRVKIVCKKYQAPIVNKLIKTKLIKNEIEHIHFDDFNLINTECNDYNYIKLIKTVMNLLLAKISNGTIRSEKHHNRCCYSPAIVEVNLKGFDREKEIQVKIDKEFINNNIKSTAIHFRNQKKNLKFKLVCNASCMVGPIFHAIVDIRFDITGLKILIKLDKFDIYEAIKGIFGIDYPISFYITGENCVLGSILAGIEVCVDKKKHLYIRTMNYFKTISYNRSTIEKSERKSKALKNCRVIDIKIEEYDDFSDRIYLKLPKHVFGNYCSIYFDTFTLCISKLLNALFNKDFSFIQSFEIRIMENKISVAMNELFKFSNLYKFIFADKEIEIDIISRRNMSSNKSESSTMKKLLDMIKLNNKNNCALERHFTSIIGKTKIYPKKIISLYNYIIDISIDEPYKEKCFDVIFNLTLSEFDRIRIVNMDNMVETTSNPPIVSNQSSLNIKSNKEINLSLKIIDNEISIFTRKDVELNIYFKLLNKSISLPTKIGLCPDESMRSTLAYALNAVAKQCEFYLPLCSEKTDDNTITKIENSLCLSHLDEDTSDKSYKKDKDLIIKIYELLFDDTNIAFKGIIVLPINENDKYLTINIPNIKIYDYTLANEDDLLFSLESNGFDNNYIYFDVKFSTELLLKSNVRLKFGDHFACINLEEVKHLYKELFLKKSNDNSSKWHINSYSNEVIIENHFLFKKIEIYIKRFFKLIGMDSYSGKYSIYFEKFHFNNFYIKNLYGWLFKEDVIINGKNIQLEINNNSIKLINCPQRLDLTFCLKLKKDQTRDNDSSIFRRISDWLFKKIICLSNLLKRETYYPIAKFFKISSKIIVDFIYSFFKVDRTAQSNILLYYLNPVTNYELEKIEIFTLCDFIMSFIFGSRKMKIVIMNDDKYINLEINLFFEYGFVFNIAYDIPSMLFFLVSRYFSCIFRYLYLLSCLCFSKIFLSICFSISYLQLLINRIFEGVKYIIAKYNCQSNIQ